MPPLAMLGVGTEEFLVLFVLFCFVLLLSTLRHTSTIVISSKYINPQGPLFVRIQGRRAGFISWLLKLCRIESAITLSVSKERIEFDEDSFFGQRTDFIPLKNVSSLGVSFSSSAIALLLAVLLFLMGIFAFFVAENAFPSVIFLICSSLTFGAYILSKRHGIFVCAPGFTSRILVQRSLIEGESLTPIDREMIRKIFRSLLDSTVGECEPEESFNPKPIPTSSTGIESPGFELKGAARRVFSSVIPAPPIPSAQPPAQSPVQPSIPPVQPPIPPVQPPIPPQFRR